MHRRLSSPDLAIWPLVDELFDHVALGLIPGLPTTFLVSPDGQVVARQVGPVTRDMIEQFIDKWPNR